MVEKSTVAAGLATVSGFILLVIGGLSFTIFDDIIRSQIIKKVLLVNGTEAYSVWQEPPVPIHLQVWVWDLLNEDDVLQGGKPNITQRGPYTYREHRLKVNITHNNNGTVTYRQIKTYHFVRNMSVGPDSETFTTVNIPYMTLVDVMRSKSAFIQGIISRALNIVFRHEGVFLRRSVREIVWGYTDPILQFAKIFDKKTFNQDFIGVLTGKNDTDDGLYTVYTGESDINQLGIIDKYNGARSINFWSSDQANMVNGTDGTVGPPFINKSLIVGMFSTDICRSVYGTYHGTVKTLYDISLYRFTAPKAAMEAPDKNPANAGFCTPAGNCLGDGVLNISTCQIVDTFHLPIVVSSPHFYEADPKYVNAVYNMDPDPLRHSTNIDIEPNTGFVMQVNKRLQINVYLKPDSSFKKTAKLRTVVFPVLWFNESALTDEAHAGQLHRELFVPKQVLGVLKYVMVLLGACILLIVCGAVVIKNLNPQPKKLHWMSDRHVAPTRDHMRSHAADVPTDDEYMATTGMLRAPSIDPLLPH